MNEQHLDLNGLKTSDLVRWLRDPEQHYIAIPRDAWFGMYGHSNHTKMQWSYATWPKELVAAQRLEELERERDAARAQVERLREALTPSDATKAAYIGEITEPDATRAAGKRTVSWTAIKDTMALIRRRAALKAAKDKEAKP